MTANARGPRPAGSEFSRIRLRETMHDLLPPIELWLPGVLAMMGLIVASGFFSGSETALFYLSHEDLRTMRVGSARERVAAALMRQPDRLLTAILFWNLVINLAYFATSVVVARRLIDAGYRAAAGVIGIVGLCVIILLGEVVPKTGAVVFRRGLASLVSIPLALAVRVLDPVSPLLAKLTRVIRRTFWPNLKRESVLEADDLERAVEISDHGPRIGERERQVLHNVLDLSEIAAEELMWPRGTFPMLSLPLDPARLDGESFDAGYVMLRNDVTGEIDRAIPAIELIKTPAERLDKAAEDVVFIPWCASPADALESLRQRFCGVAVVVNEYGETIGILTYEDIIDTILSSQPSRARRILQREPVVEVGPGTYHVDGITTLRYLCGRLEIEFQQPEEGVYSVAGLLHHQLEHLPRVGDECEWLGWRFRVIDSEDPKNVRVLCERIEVDA